MKKIKIDIPDELYEKSLGIAQKLIITFDDFCARGIERLAKEYMKEDKKEKTTDDWKDEWKELRVRLNDKCEFDNETENDWEEAIKIFSERLNKFYINPIKELIKLPKKYGGQGFIIVAAQCALIETFAAFKKGKIYDRDKYDPDKKEDEQFYYRDSGNLFIKFLETETQFKNIFCPEEGNKLVAAKVFYKDVRCGLLHETRTRTNWVIKADGLEYQAKQRSESNDFTYKGKFIQQSEKKMMIFRNQFQETLQEYFDQYKKDLKKSDKKYKELRRLFARKLDHLFDLTKKEISDYKWWNYENE